MQKANEHLAVASPQVAAPAHFPRDCSFEVDECEWINSRDNAAGRSRVDWERMSQQTLSPRNQRKPYTLPATRPRQEYFMALQTRGVAPAVTGTAYLLSNEIKASNEPLCLTFWYLMFESFIDATGPSLGNALYAQKDGRSVHQAILTVANILFRSAEDTRTARGRGFGGGATGLAALQ